MCYTKGPWGAGTVSDSLWQLQTMPMSKQQPKHAAKPEEIQEKGIKKKSHRKQEDFGHTVAKTEGLCRSEFGGWSKIWDRFAIPKGKWMRKGGHQQNVTLLAGVLLRTYLTCHFPQGCTSHLQVKSLQAWQVRPISYSALQLSLP